MSKKRERESAAALAELAEEVGLTPAKVTAKAKPAVKAKTPPVAKAAQPAIVPSPSATPGTIAAELHPLVIIPSPLNPRRGMDTEGLAELADSIVANGLLQPILVRPTTVEGISVAGEEQWYEVICGARRLAAIDLALKAGRLGADFRVPSRIRECSDSELVLLAATENLARRDMEPLDEAMVFQAMRPHVTPSEGQTVETAIGKALGVSERTVFRRLALLRCAPEVQEALRDKKITLAHAQAYALGSTEKQREILSDHLEGGVNFYGEPIGAREIRDDVVAADDGPVAVTEAVFDRALYRGEIVEDPETGDEYFTDEAEFGRLQDAALLGKVEELTADWPWVDIDRKGYGDGWQTWSVRKNDPEAGAVIRVRAGKIEVTAPALRHATVKDRTRREALGEDTSQASSRSTSHGAAEAKPATPRPPLSQPQLERLHEVKTQALRRAIVARQTHDGRVPLALACLGMLGAREVRHLQPQNDMHDYGNRAFSVPSLLVESSRLDHLVRTAALGLPDKFKKIRPDRSSEAVAAWFGALMNLPAEDLSDLFAHLVAERCGSWLSIDKPGPYRDTNMPAERLGDSPLAVAIATYTGAAEYLTDTWNVERSWFEQYGKDRLFAMALGQCRVRNANTLKKTQLVDVIMEQPKGFWSVSLFPEASFQSEAEAEKALDLTKTPLPLPEPTREAAE